MQAAPIQEHACVPYVCGACSSFAPEEALVVMVEEYTCADTAAHSGGILSLALAAAPTTETRGTSPRERTIEHRRHRPRRQCRACAVRSVQLTATD